MYNYIKPLLKKFPKNIILYIGTNNTVKETSGTVLDNLLSLKDNSNTSNAGLSRRGLHLNSQGLDKLAINFIKKIKSFKRSWKVVGSFHKKLFDCDFSQNSEMFRIEDGGASDTPNPFT